MERAEGTHRSSEEGLVWAQLLSERFGKTRNASSQFPQIPFATRTQRTLLPDSFPSLLLNYSIIQPSLCP